MVEKGDLRGHGMVRVRPTGVFAVETKARFKPPSDDRSGRCLRIVFDDRVGHRDRHVAVHGYAVVSRVPGATDIVRYCGIIDDDIARVVIGNKEDGRAVFIEVVVCEKNACRVA